MKRMMIMLSVAALMVALSASVALAASINCPNRAGGECYGTSVGDALYGTANVDKIYGFGGADLMYGYGSRDKLYGGNETGFGDKILGGGAADEIRGEAGNDGLYGQGGNDSVYGGPGGDLIVGGPGTDFLSGGTGGDEINARDSLKDTINCGNEYDTVYYDRGLDVLQGCPSTTTSRENLVAEQPPTGHFKHTGKVLVKHKGKELCVSEKATKGHLKHHLKHGDKIVNANGCASPK